MMNSSAAGAAAGSFAFLQTFGQLSPLHFSLKLQRFFFFSTSILITYFPQLQGQSELRKYNCIFSIFIHSSGAYSDCWSWTMHTDFLCATVYASILVRASACSSTLHRDLLYILEPCIRACCIY